MTVIPAPVVDALPERLWFLGNIYRVFGRSLHFCVGGDGAERTIDLDGAVIGRGGRRLRRVHNPPDDETLYRLWRLDLGWVALAGLAVALMALAMFSQGRQRVARSEPLTPN